MQPLAKRRLSLVKPQLKRGFLVFVGLSVVIGLVLLAKLLMTYQLTPGVLSDLLFAKTDKIKQLKGRTNLVLLGIGGKDHEGGDLTDTLMVVSVGYDSKDIALITIPRDIWIPTLKDKINAAYRIGEAKQVGGGMTLAKSVVEEVTGLPLHYGVLIDFTGFKQMVDSVGGIDVEIAESFTDPLYPIAGRENDLCEGDPEYACRYESVSFSKGNEHMGGERALVYARSRHAEGEAGTDFSRGRRQQAVIVALQKKLLSQDILTDIQKLGEFKQASQTSISSDMPLAHMLLLGRSLQKQTYNTRNIGLTMDEPAKNRPGLLVNPPVWQYDGLWVLTPKHDNSFTQVGIYISCMIEAKGNCEDLFE